MKITIKWLKGKNACGEGVEWYKKTLGICEHNEILDLLIDQKKYDWAIWLITKVMGKKQCVELAIFSAEQVIHIYKEKYLNDTRPQEAIQAAKNYLYKPSRAAAAAAYAAAADAAAADAAAAAAAADYAVAGDNIKIAIINYGKSLIKE